MLQIIYRLRYLIVLLLISLISHHYIFTSSGELNSGDWVYIHKAYIASMVSLKSWVAHTNLGFAVPVPNNLPFYWFASMLNIFIGFDWNLSTKFLFLFPVVFLAPFLSYTFFYKIFQSERMAFFASCLYLFNTLFLKFQLDYLTFSVVWSLFPGLLYSLISFLEKPTKLHFLLTVAYVSLSMVYEVRLALVVVVVTMFYVCIWCILGRDLLLTKMKRALLYTIGVLIGVALHSFWIIPLFLNLDFRSSISGEIHPQIFTSFHNIIDGLTLHSYQWNSGLVLYPFTRQPIELVMFLIPIFITLGYVYAHKFKIVHSFFVFFSVIFLGSLFLAKQSNGPFEGLYGYLFQHFPLFMVFRESSKFFHILALSAAFFFAIGLEQLFQILRKHFGKIAFPVVLVLLFVPTLFNTRYFITESIGGMAQGVQIPSETVELNRFIRNNPGVYRTLSLFYNRFQYQSETNPALVDIFFIFNTYFPDVDNPFLFKNFVKVIKSNKFKVLLSRLNVRYFVLPTEEIFTKTMSKHNVIVTSNYNEVYPGKGVVEISRVVDQLGYLKKKAQFGRTVVYENTLFKPKLTLLENDTDESQRSKLSFTQTSHSEYDVTVDNPLSSFSVEFAEAFHTGWEIIGCQDKSFLYIMQNKKQCMLSNKLHHSNNVKTNQFDIQTDSICKLDGVCHRINGSVDRIRFRLIFYPDYFMDIGLAISLMLLVAIFLFLLIPFNKISQILHKT